MGTRTVFVTGAGRGIGKGVARALLEAGSSVFIAELDQVSTAAAVDELKAHGDVAAVRCDVSDEDSVRNAVARCVERFGRIDGLVDNAGIANPHAGPIETLELAHWERVAGLAMYLLGEAASFITGQTSSSTAA